MGVLLGFFGTSLKYPLTFLFSLAIFFLLFENHFGNNVRSIILAGIIAVVLTALTVVFKKPSNIAISVIMGFFIGYGFTDLLGFNYGGFLFWPMFIGPAALLFACAYFWHEMAIQIATALAGGVLISEYVVFLVSNAKKIFNYVFTDWMSLAKEFNSGALFQHLIRTRMKLALITIAVVTVLGLLTQLAMNIKKKKPEEDEE